MEWVSAVGEWSGEWRVEWSVECGVWSVESGVE